LRNAAQQLVDAATDLAGKPADTAAATAAVALMRCDGSSSSSTAELPMQLQRPPGGIMRCLSMLLAGSAGNKQQQQQQQQQDFVPYLASKGSSCVYRSCQLLEAYQLLSSCARSCAAAVAAAVSSSYHHQQGLTQLQSLAGSFGLFNTATSSRGSKGDESAISDDAVAAELEHLLLLGSQQLVLLLVRQGWDVLAMNGLPLGVALPLREAVARCRTNPPAGKRSSWVGSRSCLFQGWDALTADGIVSCGQPAIMRQGAGPTHPQVRSLWTCFQ
jgi:hypothetical protein